MTKQYPSLRQWAVFLFVVLLFLGVKPLKAQHQWQYLGDYDGFYRLYDANHFCIANGRSAQYTQDGGATFTNLGLSIPASGLLAVDYVSPNELMALSSAGGSLELHYSNDGGASFSSKGTVLAPSLLGLNNREFYFLDANVGFIFQQVMYNNNLLNLLLKTKDGGANWSIVEDTGSFDLSNNLYFDKSGNIFAAASIQGITGLFLSQDTGKSFTSLSGSIPNITDGINLAYDGQQSFMVNNVIGSNHSCCYISRDGGANFSAWAASSGGGTGLAFNAPSNVVVLGGSDTTALSTDNGNSFSTLRFGAEKPSGSFYFIGAGADGHSFHIHDGNAKLWVYSPQKLSLNEDRTENAFSLFPNPASDYLELHSKSESRITGLVKIYDSKGQLHREIEPSTAERILISSLEPGCYWLLLQDEQRLHVLPFIKK